MKRPLIIFLYHSNTLTYNISFPFYRILGMGNGFPIAAVVTTPEIGEVLTRALHFNTFGGNPLSCAVGSAVLDVIKEDKLQENSLEVGTLFLEELAKMRDEFPVLILDQCFTILITSC